jgi:hypothetical protein
MELDHRREQWGFVSHAQPIVESMADDEMINKWADPWTPGVYRTGHQPQFIWITIHVPNQRSGDLYPLPNLVRRGGDPRPSIPFLDPGDPNFWQLWYVC